jgi:molybdopterin converting factor small subunit
MAQGKILFFGKLSDISGAHEWPMPDFDGVLDELAFVEKICEAHPGLAAVLAEPQNRICINQELHPSAAGVRISSDDEVAFIPPMSGG